MAGVGGHALSLQGDPLGGMRVWTQPCLLPPFPFHQCLAWFKGKNSPPVPFPLNLGGEVSFQGQNSV